ncbi:MAG: hypothetical protein AAGG01_08010, partial [Planctomycetota bacterium]
MTQKYWRDRMRLGVLLTLAVLIGGWLWLDTVARQEDEMVPAPDAEEPRSLGAPALVDPKGADGTEALRLDRLSLAAPSPSGTEALAEEADVEETPWGLLTLTVVDRATGMPVIGVFPTFEPVSAPADEEVAEEPTRPRANETDLDGQLTVEIQPRLALEFSVMFIGPDPMLFEGVLEPFDPGEQRELKVRVDASRIRRFYVSVVDDATDEALLGARIVEVDRFGQRLHMEGPLEFATWRDRKTLAAVGSDGIAELPVSRNVQKRYAALMDGYAPCIFEQSRAATGREYAERIGLRRGASLEVVVADGAGYPVSAATVRFETEFSELQAPGSTWQLPSGLGRHAVSATTDSTGRASFSRLPAATAYQLYVASDITGGRDVPVTFTH